MILWNGDLNYVIKYFNIYDICDFTNAGNIIQSDIKKYISMFEFVHMFHLVLVYF